MRTRIIDPDRAFELGNRLLVWFFIVIILYPLLYIVSASVSDPQFVNSGQMWLFPKGFTLEGYIRIFQSKELLLGYRNTIVYTLLGTFINLAVILPAAYALSRPELPGRNIIMAEGGNPTILAIYDWVVEELHPYAKLPFPLVYFTEDEIDIINMYQLDIQTYFEQMEARFITGAASIENDWDNYVRTMERIGVAEYLSAYQSAYDRWADSQ